MFYGYTLLLFDKKFIISDTTRDMNQEMFMMRTPSMECYRSLINDEESNSTPQIKKGKV